MERELDPAYLIAEYGSTDKGIPHALDFYLDAAEQIRRIANAQKPAAVNTSGAVSDQPVSS